MFTFLALVFHNKKQTVTKNCSPLLSVKTGEIFPRWKHDEATASATGDRNHCRCDRRRTIRTARNEEKVDEVIKENRGFSVDDIAMMLAVGHREVQEMFESLG